MNEIPLTANGNKKPKIASSATTSASDLDFTYLVTAGINPLNFNLDIFSYFYISCHSVNRTHLYTIVTLHSDL